VPGRRISVSVCTFVLVKQVNLGSTWQAVVVEEHEGAILSLELPQRGALRPQHETYRVRFHVERAHVAFFHELLLANVDFAVVALLQRDVNAEPRQLALCYRPDYFDLSRVAVFVGVDFQPANEHEHTHTQAHARALNVGS